MYTGLCDDPKIQEIVAALGGTGKAACFAPDASSPNAVNLLRDLDFGIAATYDDIHFTVDPFGVLQLDSANTGGVQSWDTAMSACANLGKRTAGGSALRALYDITGGVPSGFSSANSYWSSTPHPTNSANAYLVTMTTGLFGSNAKSVERYVRCGI